MDFLTKQLNLIDDLLPAMIETDKPSACADAQNAASEWMSEVSEAFDMHDSVNYGECHFCHLTGQFHKDYYGACNSCADHYYHS